MQRHMGHSSWSLAQCCNISKPLPSHPPSSPSPRGEKPNIESWELAEVSSSALPLPKPKEEEAALPLTSMCWMSHWAACSPR